MLKDYIEELLRLDTFWDSLSDYQKFAIVEQRPEFHKRVTFPTKIADWWDLLKDFPKLDIFAPDTLWRNLNKRHSGTFVYWRLRRHPKAVSFIRRIQPDFYKNWWVDLLEEYPQLAKYCTKWKKFDHCDWQQLRKSKSFTVLEPYFHKYAKRELLLRKPRKPQKPSTDYWDRLLTYLLEHPQKIAKCKELPEMPSSFIVPLAIEHREALNNYPQEKLNCYAWVQLTSKYPEYYKSLDRPLTPYFWVEILRQQPQLASECNMFEKFTTYDWIELLLPQPKLLPEFEKVARSAASRNQDFLHYTHWKRLLLKYPQFFKYCKSSNAFNQTDWYDLLSAQPTLLKHYPEWNFSRLRDSLPDSYDVYDAKLDFAFLQNAQLWGVSPMMSRFILSKYPELVHECKSLSLLRKNDWVKLLTAQPILASYVDDIIYDEFTEEDWDAVGEGLAEKRKQARMRKLLKEL